MVGDDDGLGDDAGVSAAAADVVGGWDDGVARSGCDVGAGSEVESCPQAVMARASERVSRKAVMSASRNFVNEGLSI